MAPNWQWFHVDYDGPEDCRVGCGSTFDACVDDIEEGIAEDRFCDLDDSTHVDGEGLPG